MDPSHSGGWIGQAMVAEFMNHEETQDLFHHASQLAYHVSILLYWPVRDWHSVLEAGLH